MALPIFANLDEFKDSELQTRVALNEETLQEYAEIYREDEYKLPPVEAVQVGLSDPLLLTDGFHRVEAARRAGRTRIRCLLTKGTPTDALKAALKANAEHGLRRTNADKRKALGMAWDRREELFGGEPSHEMLAEACGVSKSTARRFRDELPTVLKEHSGERIGANGKHYVKDTAKPADVLTDHVGQEVPPRLAPCFRSKSALQAINKLSKALRELELARESGENGEMAFMEQRNFIAIEEAITRLRHARPYAVCPVCAGEGCRECNGYGFMTKHRYVALTHEIEHVGGIENLNPTNAISTNTDGNNSSREVMGEDQGIGQDGEVNA